MHPKIKKVLLFSAATALIVLGVIGLVLPFLQGFLFIAIGLVLLSFASSTAREWIDRHTFKFPAIHTFVHDIETKVAHWIGEDPPHPLR